MSREGIPEELKCTLEDDGKFGQPAGFWGLSALIHFKGEPNIHPARPTNKFISNTEAGLEVAEEMLSYHRSW